MFDWLKKLFRPAQIEYAEPDETGPVIPVAPPTSGPSPAQELQTDSVDPPRE